MLDIFIENILPEIRGEIVDEISIITTGLLEIVKKKK